MHALYDFKIKENKKIQIFVGQRRSRILNDNQDLFLSTKDGDKMQSAIKEYETV